MRSKYHPKLTEPLWQQKWEHESIQPAKIKSKNTDYYIQAGAPYPTDELHMGHVRTALVGDVLTRFYRMQGFNVTHSFSWDGTSGRSDKPGPERQDPDHIKAQLTRLGLTQAGDRVMKVAQPEHASQKNWLLLKLKSRAFDPTNAIADQHGTQDQARLIKLGQVRNTTYHCPKHGYRTPLEGVVRESQQARCSLCHSVLRVRYEKMSRAKQNWVSPHQMFQYVGADSARLFCLFAAPPAKDVEWSESGVLGCYHFLRRMWSFYHRHQDYFSLFDKLAGPIDETRLEQTKVSFHRQIHRTIESVTRYLHRDCQTNTAIAAVMKLLNSTNVFDDLGSRRDTLRQHETFKLLRLTLRTLARLLYPLVPHFAEEVWSNMGYQNMICCAGWPTYQAKLTGDEMFTLAVQVNGKLRSTLRISRDVNQHTLQQAALADPNIQRWIQDKNIHRIIAIPQRVVNLVVG